MCGTRMRFVVTSTVLAVFISAIGYAAEQAATPSPQALNIKPEALKELGITKSQALSIANKLILTTEATPDEGRAPLKVSFKVEADEKVENPQYAWQFGDGSAESHEASPTHTFKEPGLYTVKVSVNRM